MLFASLHIRLVTLAEILFFVKCIDSAAAADQSGQISLSLSLCASIAGRLITRVGEACLSLSLALGANTRLASFFFFFLSFFFTILSVLHLHGRGCSLQQGEATLTATKRTRA